MAWSLDLTDSQVQAVNLKILFASSQYGRGTHKSFRSHMLNFCTPRIDKIILLHKLQNFIQRSCQSWSSFANSHWGEALAYYTCAKQIIERYKRHLCNTQCSAQPYRCTVCKYGPTKLLCTNAHPLRSAVGNLLMCFFFFQSTLNWSSWYFSHFSNLNKVCISGGWCWW